MTVAPRIQAGRGRRFQTCSPRALYPRAWTGQGKTNAEIAAELFAGTGTVKTHVHHVFAKLQLRDRAAVVFDHDLVRNRPA